jgi:hypothetical protein
MWNITKTLFPSFIHRMSPIFREVIISVTLCNVPSSERFLRYSYTLYTFKIVHHNEILRTVSNTGICYSSDIVGTVYLVKYRTFPKIPPLTVHLYNEIALSETVENRIHTHTHIYIYCLLRMAVLITSLRYRSSLDALHIVLVSYVRVVSPLYLFIHPAFSN